jgi:hypothetical protein
VKPLRILATLTLILLLAGIAAADSRNAEYVQPAKDQYSTSQCLELQVRSLYQATNTAQTIEDQEKHLNAARAYGELYELSQPC